MKKHLIDLTSSLVWYDEQGKPKDNVPSRFDTSTGEWLYALNPKRFDKPLEGVALMRHKEAIKELKERVKCGY